MWLLLGWVGQHGFDLISAIGIIAGLAFTTASFREDIRSRRLANLIRLTEQHRDIWEESLTNPALSRIRDPKADLYTKPVTAEESQFVMLLMFHLYCWFRAASEGEVSALEGVERDIKSFFGRPIAKRVWEDRKAYFDSSFRGFVDSLL